MVDCTIDLLLGVIMVVEVLLLLLCSHNVWVPDDAMVRLDCTVGGSGDSY